MRESGNRRIVETKKNVKTDDKPENKPNKRFGETRKKVINEAYEHILSQLVRMIDQPEKWVIVGRLKA